jgi:hypothetical protein
MGGLVRVCLRRYGKLSGSAGMWPGGGYDMDRCFDLNMGSSA